MMTDTSDHSSSSVTVLAFDTSTVSLAAAVVRNGEVLGSLQSFAERNHSVLIVPEIKRLMAECGVGPEDLDVIAAGQGPGSYTGVRIAVSVGKTLAWTWNKTLLGVSSLEAMAHGVWESHAQSFASGAGPVWIVPVMDARRGQVFSGRFVAGPGSRWERLDPDGIRLSADYAAAIREAAGGMENPPAVWIVGETEQHGPVFESAEAQGPRYKVLPWSMEAGSVGKLAEARFRRGEKDDIHSFVPNYTQMTEAEVKWQAAARRD
jgi:tRNA threonylcarbamoyladenosine biosynthesis protein TsaB